MHVLQLHRGQIPSPAQTLSQPPYQPHCLPPQMLCRSNRPGRAWLCTVLPWTITPLSLPWTIMPLPLLQAILPLPWTITPLPLLLAAANPCRS